MNNKKTSKQETGWTVQSETELLKFLSEVMPKESRKKVKKILGSGQVFVNHRSTTQFNDKLKQGDRVQIKPERHNIKLKGLTIIHEDDDVIVVDKEAGLLSMASETERQMTAYRLVSDHVQSTNQRNRIFIVHRLDRDTSGVMIFAKRKDIQQKLQQNWKHTVSERTYIALVEGKVNEDGAVTSWLTENKALIVHSSQKPGKGKKAVTKYKVLKSNRNHSLLKVNLETGRKNQIRVHMQDIGHPIVGDKKYGAHNNPIRRMGLHAHVLAFTHPVSGEHLRFESKVPEAFTKGFK